MKITVYSLNHSVKVWSKDKKIDKYEKISII